MSNGTSIEAEKNDVKAAISIICDPAKCKNSGTCMRLNPETSVDWYECICDLWHSGQSCEFDVPVPIVITITCTVFVSAIVFFCWCSSYKFSKRKINTPRNRRRFVDHLHRHQRLEKYWLRSKLEEESKMTGRSRDIPFDPDEQTDQEAENKEKPKEENKKNEEVEVLKRPEPNRERELEKLKEEETARQLKLVVAAATGKQLKKQSRESISMLSAPEPSNRDASCRSTTSTMSTSSGGPRELTGVVSSTTNNALPEDAPKDNKDHHEKLLKDIAKQEAWAEVASAELNKKHKKK